MKYSTRIFDPDLKYNINIILLFTFFKSEFRLVEGMSIRAGEEMTNN